MMIEKPGFFETYGGLRIYPVTRVLELDAQGAVSDSVHVLDADAAYKLKSRMTIVVPIKDDELLSLAGVVAGVPHASRLVIVSASSRSPVDRYRHEVELVKSIAEKTGRSVLIMHQRDPAWGSVLRGTRLEPLLDEGGLVRLGKGEGMLLGFLAAVWLGSEYVGFVDSDNYVPGSVLEYVNAYAAGFSLARSGYAMVRIKWPYKGKLPGVSSEIYLRRRGRVSVHTNSILNHALSLAKGVETEIIQTGNSGEHALTVRLGLELEWAGGFAVEPYQIVHLLERCWLDPQPRCPGREGVEIFQVETRNPHLHAERGEEHLAAMLAVSLGTVYHSRLASEPVKREILRLLREHGYEGEPPAPRVYSPPSTVNPRKLFEEYLSESGEALYIEPRV